MIFYTYLWLRENGTPYYVGKGCRVRAFRKGCPPKERVLLEPHTSETDAFDAEKFLIAYYGRIDKKTGILRNHTDGGDGTSGWTPSEEVKKKIGDAQRGEKNHHYGKPTSAAQKQSCKTRMKAARGVSRPEVSGSKNGFFGKKHSAKELLLCGNGRRGKKHSVETRIKMKAAHAARFKKQNQENKNEIATTQAH